MKRKASETNPNRIRDRSFLGAQIVRTEITRIRRFDFGSETGDEVTENIPASNSVEAKA